jgi:hypothetical protein
LAAFSDVFFGLAAPGCETRPEAMPRPRGRRMEIGALLKMVEGRVRCGMYDMVGEACEGRGVPKGSMMRAGGVIVMKGWYGAEAVL